MRDTRILADVFLNESADTFTFGNVSLALTFSRRTGRWLGIRDQHAGCWLSGVANLAQDAASQGTPPVLLRVGGKRLETCAVRNSRVPEYSGACEVGRETRCEAVAVRSDGKAVTCEVTCAEGDWVLTSLYRLAPSSGALERSVRIRYTGASFAHLRDVRFMVPLASITPSDERLLEAPAYPQLPHIPLSTMPQGLWPGLDSRPNRKAGRAQHDVDAPGSTDGLVAVYAPSAGTVLLCWPFNTSEFAIIELVRAGDLLTLVHWQLTSEQFDAGTVIEVGSQYIDFAHGSWDDVLSAWNGKRAAALPAPATDLPAWSIGMAIYEAHIGQAPFLGGRVHAPYPEVDDLTRDLPRIHNLGFEVLQLMPHWPFCGYTVHDYTDIAAQYGDARALRALIDRAHQLGMRVILDIVLHGAVDKEIIRRDMQAFGTRYDFIFGEWLKLADERSRYRSEHPEWFMCDEDGNPAHLYTWAFDLAEPSFQAYLVRVLRGYLNDLGVDGFRFDAPTWNCMPNWKHREGWRPSAAYYAGWELLHRARQELKASHPQALFYTEPGGPLFRGIMDAVYNYAEEWLTGALLEPISPRGYAGTHSAVSGCITAAQAAEWLHYHHLSLPPGAQTVHHLDSHDTFWWGELAQFRSEAFGREAANAMFAVFALIGGGVMNYAGAEEGASGFYGALLRLRQATPALCRGRCDYASSSDQPMLFTCLRVLGSEHAIPLVNLSQQPLRANVRVPAALAGGSAGLMRPYDLLAEAWLDTNGVDALPHGEWMEIPVDMPPYGVRVLRLAPK